MDEMELIKEALACWKEQQLADNMRISYINQFFNYQTPQEGKLEEFLGNEVFNIVFSTVVNNEYYFLQIV